MLGIPVFFRCGLQLSHYYAVDHPTCPKNLYTESTRAAPKARIMAKARYTSWNYWRKVVGLLVVVVV